LTRNPYEAWHKTKPIGLYYGDAVPQRITARSSRNVLNELSFCLPFHEQSTGSKKEFRNSRI
jgi:hypothetical protein